MVGVDVFQSAVVTLIWEAPVVICKIETVMLCYSDVWELLLPSYLRFWQNDFEASAQISL